ncbi:U exon, partial [Turkey siadenovirus A]
MGNKCSKCCSCCKPREINQNLLKQNIQTVSEDSVDGMEKGIQTEYRPSATQLLCQTCLYWLIRYCIQNSDLILETLFPSIHDQVD